MYIENMMGDMIFFFILVFNKIDKKYFTLANQLRFNVQYCLL